jgi:hypothetical protein
MPLKSNIFTIWNVSQRKAEIFVERRHHVQGVKSPTLKFNNVIICPLVMTTACLNGW